MLRSIPINMLTTALVYLSLTTSVVAKDGPSTPIPAQFAFKENKGQITNQYHQSRADIDFGLTTSSGISIFAGDGQLHYQWSRADAAAGKNNIESFKVETYRLDMVLVGANRDAEIITEDRQPGYDRYYQAHLPANGVTAYSYNRVTYRNIYPGIDWVLYTQNNQLKYDFIVHAGADASLIKMKYDGGTSVTINDGAVTVSTPMGSISEAKPYTYDAETGKEIASSFSQAGNTIGFNVPASSSKMVIDPSINWITYYGGPIEDYGWGLKADGAGNVFMSGLTRSTSNIATSGTHSNIQSGNSDGYLVKFNAAGVRQWGTYYGGTDADFFTSVALDASGNIYASGHTFSTSGIGTAGTNMPTKLSGLTGGMLVKFDNTGSRVWGTYSYAVPTGGMNGYLLGLYLACDPSGNIFMNDGGCVSKYTSAGALYWRNPWTSGQNYCTGIACDNAGNAYALGYENTTSNGFDIGLAKFASNGLITYNLLFGGDKWDLPLGIELDNAGNIYISGETWSATGISTPGSYRTALSSAVIPNNGNFDGFLMKLNNAGTKQWGTYLGNSSFTFRAHVVVGLNDNLYVGANDYYSGGALKLYTMNADDGTMKSALTKSQAGAQSELTVAYSPAGYVYMCGGTNGGVNLATTGAHQTSLSGGSDGYLASFAADTLVAIDQPFNDTVHCTGSTFKLPYSVTFAFGAGNTFTAYLSDASGSFASPVAIGTLVSSVSDTILCTIPGATLPGNGYRIRIESSGPATMSANNGTDIRIDNGVVPAILTYTANPGTNVGPGRMITFSTTSSGMGATPAYQWKKNGIDISGATNATYSGTTTIDFDNTDVITVEITSSVACATPASVTSGPLTISINTGVSEVASAGWQIFPNPSNGWLVVTGDAAEVVTIELVALDGRVLANYTATPANGKFRKEILLDNRWPNGSYIFRATSAGSIQNTRFNIAR